MKTRRGHEEEEKRQKPHSAAPIQNPAKTAPSNNQKKAWERERDQLEGIISKLEKRQNEIHLVLGNSDTYNDKQKTLELLDEQRSLEKTLGESLSRWEEVCNLLS